MKQGRDARFSLPTQPLIEGDIMSLIEVHVDESLNPILIGAAELARLLQISVRTLWRLRSAGELPEAVRFARTVRWRLAQIKTWIESNCPEIEAHDSAKSKK